MNWLREIDLNLLRAINQGWNCEFANNVFWAFSTLGVGIVQLAGLVPVALIKSARLLIFQLCVCWAVSGIASQLFKSVTVRLRPTAFEGTIPTPGETIFHSSFPSGHSCTAFGIAMGFSLFYCGKNRTLWSVCAIAWAALVGISRIYRGVHWPTDVLAGALIGCSSSFLTAAVFAFAKERRR